VVGIEPEGVDVQPPDFLRLTGAYGYPYRLIEDPTALRRALPQLGAHRQIVVPELRAEAYD
jgi:hypothetical protein